MSSGGNWRMSPMKYDERQPRDAQTTEGETELGNWIWTLQRPKSVCMRSFNNVNSSCILIQIEVYQARKGELRKNISHLNKRKRQKLYFSSAYDPSHDHWPWYTKCTKFLVSLHSFSSTQTIFHWCAIVSYKEFCSIADVCCHPGVSEIMSPVLPERVWAEWVRATRSCRLCHIVHFVPALFNPGVVTRRKSAEGFLDCVAEAGAYFALPLPAFQFLLPNMRVTEAEYLISARQQEEPPEGAAGPVPTLHHVSPCPSPLSAESVP